MVDEQKPTARKMSQHELFRSIGDICAVINAINSNEELLDRSLKLTMGLFGAQRGSIFILEEENSGLVLKCSQGLELSEQKSIIKRLGEGIVGRVAEMKKPIYVQDIASDGRFANYQARSSYRTSSFICAPLLIKDKMIGVINLTDKDCGSQFEEEEMQMLDFLASHIALNYRRIELLAKFQNVVQESQSLRHELGKSSAEADNLKKQVLVQEKLATVGKLAGGIAHEFNNPLDGVIRYTNLCLEQVHEEDVVHGYLLEIKQGLKRMANIVKSLLACSRNVQPASVKINANECIEQALQYLQAEISHKNLKIERQYETDLPQIYDLGFERIISNVLRNAVDASDEDGLISIVTEREGGAIVLWVKDGGCGIDESMLDKIFEPFYTSKDIEKGCGLGLTIVSEIVKAYNGQIDVQSKQGKGTEFKIVIPVQ